MPQPAPTSGVLGTAVALVAGAVLLVLGFMFSLVLFALIATATAAVWIYFWWKTRALRKVMREQAPSRTGNGGGHVVEGEAVVVEEFRTEQRHVVHNDAEKP